MTVAALGHARGLWADAGRWFGARSPRERALVGVAAALALGFVGWEGVWRPLAALRADAASDIARLDASIAQVRAAGAAPAPALAADPGLPPSTVVTRSAATLGLTIRRLEPDGARLRVSLDEAAVDAVLAWLALLEREYGLRVAAIEMDRRPAPGLVATRITLEE